MSFTQISARAVLATLRILIKLFLFVSAIAFAKPVVVEWETSKLAADYECVIEQSGKQIFHGHVKGDHWSGDLAPGLYTYRLRAFDHLGRPGQWSANADLAVLAAAPKMLAPQDRSTFYSDLQHHELTLKWDESVEWVHLRVLRDDRVVVDETLRAHEFALKNLEPGKYEWQLSSAVKSEQEKRSWAGESATERFEVKKLIAAAGLSPHGMYESVQSEAVRFHWDAVEGADHYEVKLSRVSPGRDSASEPRVKKVKGHSAEFVLHPGERYRWEVRAIASTGAEADAPSAELVIALPQNYTRRDKLSPEIKLSHLGYQERRIDHALSIGENAVQVGGSMGWEFWRGFSANATPSLTLMPVHKHDQAEVRLGRVDGRIGYRWLRPESAWLLRTEVGAMYTRMWVSPKAYGINKYSGPQVAVNVGRRVNNHGDLAQLNLRLGFISDQYGFLGHSRSTGVALSYWRDSWKFFVDFETSKVDFSDQNAKLQIFSLGVGYGF